MAGGNEGGGGTESAASLLAAVGMDEYAAAAEAKGIKTVEQLAALGDAGLKELGVGKLIHRRKLLIRLGAAPKPVAPPRATGDAGESASVSLMMRLTGGAHAAASGGSANSPTGGASGKGGEGAAPGTVNAPWARDVPAEGGLQLGAEMRHFAAFLRPTKQERTDADSVRYKVQYAVQRQCRGADTHLAGSRGIGVALPASGTDVVVEGFAGDPAQLAADLSDAWKDCTDSVSVDAPSPSGVRFTHRDAAKVERRCHVWLRTDPAPSPERKLARFLRTTLGEHGRAAALVVRMVLQQSNLDGVERGGMSGTAIAMLVASELTSASPSDAGGGEAAPGAALLLRVLQKYGQWGWDADAVAASAVVRRVDTSDGAASVLSPFSGANLAQGCTKVRQLSAMLEYARLAIGKWGEACPTPETVRSRGVTPLSAVIAHKGLWERSHEIRRQQIAEAAKISRGFADCGLPPRPGSPSAAAPATWHADPYNEASQGIPMGGGEGGDHPVGSATSAPPLLDGTAHRVSLNSPGAPPLASPDAPPAEPPALEERDDWWDTKSDPEKKQVDPPELTVPPGVKFQTM